uniref:Uncharacterized protein n=1 Tax=Rhizophora mucronata TaxID=61149 RepID=A0A2P2PWD0_RHIMU
MLLLFGHAFTEFLYLSVTSQYSCFFIMAKVPHCFIFQCILSAVFVYINENKISFFLLGCIQ